MARKIRVWVEMFATQDVNELFDVPDDWDAMTEAERESHMSECFESIRNDMISGGYELVEG
jgi:hypothetical protein